MADFATIDTPRVRLHYSVQGLQHSMMGRMPIDDTIINATDYISMLIGLVDAMATQRYSDWAVLAYEFAAQDSDVFLPIAPGAFTPPAAGAVSTTGREVAAAAAQIRFEGKGTGGSKVSITMFGTNWFPGLTAATDFRVTGTENPVIGDAVDYLNSGSHGVNFRAIDGSVAIWKDYVNVKFNDKILNRIRNI